MVLAVGAIYLIADGKEVTGLIALLPPLGAIAAYFLFDYVRGSGKDEPTEGRPPAAQGRSGP